MEVLWELFFDQLSSPTRDSELTTELSTAQSVGKTFLFPPSSTDLAFDDSVLQRVRLAWQSVSGNVGGFMQFEDREVGAYEDEDE